ncbi:MAG: FAD-binding oxidoreductase [Candidatus Sericytochromatia bacterium]|uniref:FAD-binding oxidoreductase n=1 Tax=Candidatus Tanganyikabacteria bacterium TaxID=2961651 RepID=A0A938BJU0_9BACT|nr:FAD-binding oxidoreductase [Candidatus Tanganyikabacteria bacterium]
MDTAEVVIVGGGIIGASIAYHLAARGMKDVLLLEKELFFGAESTGKCAGGIRAQFTTPVNIRLSMRSVGKFERFADEMGVPIVFHQVGYMFMSTTPAQWDHAQRNVALQRSLGLDVDLLTAGQVHEKVPELRVDDVLGATFCATDGIGDPHEFLQGYLKRNRDLGVRVINQRPATGIRLESGRVSGVETSAGPVSTPVVVNAAGAWAALVAKHVGLDLPIQPVRRHIATTAPLAFVKPTYPMMVDNGTGLYMHPESGGLLMGMAKRDEPPAYRTDVDEEFVMEIATAAVDRMPALEVAEINAAWAGLYEVTPDHHPIITAHEGVPGFYTCAGFSGHGFMHAPAAGEVVAQLILDGKSEIDVSELGMDRFTTPGKHGAEEVMVI